MKPFDFYMPTKIIFERGSIQRCAQEAAKLGKKTLIVTDKPMLDTGLLNPVFEAFQEKEMDYVLWSDIVPNPRDIDIEKGAAFAKEQEIDSMVAIGGGSAIDTAKAIGAILENGGKCADWREGNLTHTITPLICVPTTCGTGSEVTHESIVNNTTTMEKDCIWGDEVSAKVAILDPDVLTNLPKKLLASTGMDALTHAVEAYVCKASNPMTDALAETAIRLIGKSLIKAVEENCEEAYENMLAASCMAGAAFGNSDVAAVHSISEALGGYYDIPHGIANAMMLAEVSRLSVPGAPEKYADVARFLGVKVEGMSAEAAAYAGVDYMEKLTERLQIPKFCEMEMINPKDFKRLARTAANADETFDNPVLFTEEDFEALFERLYKGK